MCNAQAAIKYEVQCYRCSARNGKSVVAGAVRLSGEKYVGRLLAAPDAVGHVIGQTLRRVWRVWAPRSSAAESAADPLRPANVSNATTAIQWGRSFKTLRHLLGNDFFAA